MKMTRWLSCALLLCGFTAMAYAEDVTVDKVFDNPATYKGETVIFDRVKLSGDYEKRDNFYLFGVRTTAGKLISAATRPQGISFMASIPMSEKIVGEVEQAKEYPVRLTCSIRKNNPKGKLWFAEITQGDFYSGEGMISKSLYLKPVNIAGKWSGKQKDAPGSKDDSLDIKEENRVLSGSWRGFKVLEGTRINDELAKWQCEHDGHQYDVTCKLTDGGRALDMSYEEKYRQDGETITSTGTSTLTRAGKLIPAKAPTLEPESTLTGKWRGKYTAGIARGETSMELKETNDGTFQGTWTDEDGTNAIKGVRSSSKIAFSLTWQHPKGGPTMTDVSGDIAADGKTLSINYISSWKENDKIKIEKGAATLKR